mmetsp:Transcript_29092/g.44956  ORF Transcript_29092/g.44956 Transcript_29092/m.44956 type:complete len:115 (-) Transcript_29092:304-648(-)
MEVAYVYTKRRSEFGKHVEFSNGETQILESIPPTDAYDDDYQIRTTTATGTDNTPQPVSRQPMNRGGGGPPPSLDSTVIYGHVAAPASMCCMMSVFRQGDCCNTCTWWLPRLPA